jgi:molybdenum cofactor cytidylyltransferase
LNKEKPAGILLAAGESKRFGSPKQLVNWGGIPLINHVINIIKNSGIEDIFVVLGGNYDQIEKTLPDCVRIILNDSWEVGLSSSIKVGISEAKIRGFDHAIIFIGDQPFLTGKDIADVIKHAREKPAAGIIATRVNDIIVQPVMYRKKYFDQLCRLEGDQGGKTIIMNAKDVAFVESENVNLLMDIDSREDYQSLQNRHS